MQGGFMQKLRTIVVDDEPLACQYLVNKLKNYHQIDVVASCKNGREAMQLVYEQSPDLVFLDIQMPGLNGLDVAKQLQSDTMPMVIFATAFEQYALDAFDAHAVDYIVKPIDEKRLELAINRALLRHVSINTMPEIQKGEVIGAIADIETLQNKTVSWADNTSNDGVSNNGDLRKIIIKDRDEIHLINQADIEWVDAAGDYVCVHANGDTHVKRSTLKEMEDELNPVMFKRVHRSTIVNLSCIEKVIPLNKGEYFLLLGEHQKVKVSRKYKDIIRSFLEQ